MSHTYNILYLNISAFSWTSRITYAEIDKMKKSVGPGFTYHPDHRYIIAVEDPFRY